VDVLAGGQHGDQRGADQGCAGGGVVGLVGGGERHLEAGQADVGGGGGDRVQGVVGRVGAGQGGAGEGDGLVGAGVLGVEGGGAAGRGVGGGEDAGEAGAVDARRGAAVVGLV